MKRKITSATSGHTSPAVKQYIETIGDLFYNSGYTITGYGSEEGIVLNAKYRGSDINMMPTINLQGRVLEDYIYTSLSMTFPELTFDIEDGDYYDTIHYWLSRWEHVGNYVTELNEYAFSLDDFYNDDEQ